MNSTKVVANESGELAIATWDHIAYVYEPAVVCDGCDEVVVAATAKQVKRSSIGQQFECPDCYAWTVANQPQFVA